MSPENAFLSQLSGADARELQRQIRPVHLELGDVLTACGDLVSHIYFPETALLSIVSSSFGGQSVEVGMVGREGGGGLLEILTKRPTPYTILVQIEGEAWQAPASAVRSLSETSPSFRQALWDQIAFSTTEARQAVVCQARHRGDRRLARWLLEAMERIGRDGAADDFVPLTQEYLAAMLGMQRTTVSTMAREMQSRGLIRYQRGRIHIVDRNALEKVACECRSILREARRAAREGLALSG